MTQIAKKARTPRVARDTKALSQAEFKARLKARIKKDNGPKEALDPNIFDDWEDAEDLLAHFNTAPVQKLTRANLVGTRRRTSPAPRPRPKSSAKTRGSSTPRVGVPLKEIQARKRQSKATRAAPTYAQTFDRGVSHGPPRRYIGVKFITPEIDVSEAKFRRQRRGIGKCTGGKLKDVQRAFAFSYFMLACAKAEVRSMKRSGADARALWHSYMKHEKGSLAFWFGENYSQSEVMTMLHKIDDMLSEWSMAYCGGFRDILPVFIRCKSKNGVGDGPARHIVKNTIELFPRYFDMPRARQSATMLHEMGHRCKSLLKPRDESHPLCTGGWKRDNNMCYRTSNEITDFGDMFDGGNPRVLAEAATGGRSSAKKALLNNIDNYVCYMWNRYADHGERTMYLLREGAKQAKPAKSTSKPKPVSKPV